MAEPDPLNERDGEARLPGARMAAVLAFAPIAALTLWLAGIADDHPWRDATVDLLQTYAALSLAYAAGTRRGVMLAAKDQHRTKPPGIDPLLCLVVLLAAWALLFASPPHVFALLAVAFAAQGAWDAFAAHAGQADARFGRGRISTTLLTVAAMVAAFLATA